MNLQCKVKHPKESCNHQQEGHLKSLPEKERRFFSLFYSYSNAAYKYHNLPVEPTEIDYQEWLSGLKGKFAESMKKKGFENCKTIFSFTRYVREKHDIGMDEFIKNLMGEHDYDEFIAITLK